MRGLGTLINTATVLAGGIAGRYVGHLIPERIRTTVVQAIALATIVMGIDSVVDTRNLVFPLVGTAIGAVIGELLRIEDRLEGVGTALKKKFVRDEAAESSFVTGFVTATLLFCIGPLTILGAIEDASGDFPSLYVIKATLDGVMALVFASLYGIGAAFSALSVLVVQGGLTAVGTGLDSLLDDRMRTEMFASGGFMVLAIGLNLLGVTKIRLGSLLPGLVVTPVLVAIFAV
ncbi:MAG: DUF554 domain-containing protein [Ilumatobacteraceae bacterium]